MAPQTQNTSLTPALTAASHLIAKHGFVTVFACAALYLAIVKLPDILDSNLSAQTAATREVHQTLDAHIEAVSTRGVEERDHETRMLLLLEAICRGVNRGNPAAEELCAAVQR